MRCKDSSRVNKLLATVFVVLCHLPIWSCGHGQTALPELRKQSQTLAQQAGNRALSAEGRLRIAHELFEHRLTYESIIRQPSAPAKEQKTARALQRSDADAAGAAMHAIAEEHLVNGETEKARAIYYSVLTMFADDDYASIRKAAESRLQDLDDKEKRKKALR